MDIIEHLAATLKSRVFPSGVGRRQKTKLNRHKSSLCASFSSHKINHDEVSSIPKGTAAAKQ